jgi:hypothetical protein
MKLFTKEGMFYSSLIHLIIFSGVSFSGYSGVSKKHSPRERSLKSSEYGITAKFSEMENIDFCLDPYLDQQDNYENSSNVYTLLDQKIKYFQKRSKRRNIDSLEELTKRSESLPKEDLRGAVNYVQRSLNLEPIEYSPVNLVDNFPDINKVVVFYRIIGRENKRYFQEILVDKEGNYLVNSEILEEEMSEEDKMNHKIFEITEKNPNLRAMRNNALDIILRMVRD